jgi:ankyrin repeat protein
MSGVELSRLIADGDLDSVKLLLETGTKEEIKKYVEYKSKLGDSPLHLASIEGYLEIMKLLIFHGADVNSKNDSGNTPLIWASKFGYLEIVKLLIDNNADVISKNKDGKTPLIIAKKNERFDIVNYISGVELLIYLKTGDLEQAEDLLEKTADIDTQHKDKMGNTFLHLASSRGYLEIVKILIVKKNFDVNVKNNNGYTPLHSAAEGGHLDVIIYLIDNKGDINIKNSDGDTAILLAIQNSHFNIVKYLFDNKDVINLTYGYSALIEIARQNENWEAQEYFTEKYADINIENDKRKIELTHAAQVQDLTTVDQLISEILAVEGISFVKDIKTDCKTKFGQARTDDVYYYEDFDKYDRFVTFSDGHCYSFNEIKRMHESKAKRLPLTNNNFDEFDLNKINIVIELLGLITDSKTKINVYDNERNNDTKNARNNDTKNEMNNDTKNERNNDTKNERKGGYIKSKKTKKSRKNKTKKGKTKKNKKNK